MESVPFLFCDAVAATLSARFLQALSEVYCAYSGELLAHEKRFELEFSFRMDESSGQWSYWFSCIGSEQCYRFSDVQKMDLRRVRVTEIIIYSERESYSSSESYPASGPEIKRMLDFSLSLLSAYDSHIAFAQNTPDYIPLLERILSTKHLFNDISVYNFAPVCERFLSFQLRNVTSIKWLSISGEWPEWIRTELEDFLLSDRSSRCNVHFALTPGILFDFTFFERLALNAENPGKGISIWRLPISFQWNDLDNFKREARTFRYHDEDGEDGMSGLVWTFNSSAKLVVLFHKARSGEVNETVDIGKGVR